MVDWPYILGVRNQRQEVNLPGTTEVRAYPIIYDYREVVVGKGFAAHVRAQGRARLVNEGDDGWWVYGVDAGGIAETGDTAESATLKFQRWFRLSLTEFATEADDLPAFNRLASEFFCQSDSREELRWLADVSSIRAGAKVGDEWVNGLERRRAEVKCFVEVVELDPAAMSPTQNPKEEITLQAA